MSMLGVLGLIFIVLKVLEVGVVATWSWWLVLLPWYGGLALVLALMAFGLTVTVLAGKRSYR